MKEAIELLDRIRKRLVCIGGPFNDNREKFTDAQLKYLKPILDDVEEFLDDHWCHECERIK